MKNWEEDDSKDHCTAAEDLADARAVAQRLGIRLHTVNFSSEYWELVFSDFLNEYKAGRTPNPDVLCNKEIKFRAFLDYAISLGATRIATGHYARTVPGISGCRLRLAADAQKDQTYFLHLLDQEQLNRSLFPLGGHPKSEVRTLARRAGLPTAEKRDSTGICFIGERRFREFLSRWLPRIPGPIETPEGMVVGEHPGLSYYTVGQRQGLGIGGVTGNAEAPWYVASKDLERNALVVVQGHEHPLLMTRRLRARRLHWIAGGPPADPPFRCWCRLRHRQTLQECTLEDIRGPECLVSFPQAQRAVTPGQSAVFYLGDDCLGGAVIEHAWND